MSDTNDTHSTEKKAKLSKSGFKKLLRLFSYMKPYRVPFILGFLALALSSFTLLAFPYFAGKLIDVATGKNWILNSVNQVVMALLLILFVQSIFSYLRVYLFAQVNQRAMAALRTDAYSSLIKLPMLFYDNRRIGELISRITSDISMLQDTFSTTLAELFRQTIILLAGTAVLIVMAPKLTLFMLATFPILVIAGLVFGRFIRSLSKKTQDALANANVIVEETLQAVSIVKSFSSENIESKRYAGALDNVVKIALKTASYRGAFISFIIFALFGGIVATLWYGATLVQDGELTVGYLLSFVIYTAFIGGSIGGLGDIYSQLQRAVGASERVIEILDEKQEEDSGAGAEKTISGSLEFKKVSFSYPTRSDIAVLKDVSFKVLKGEKVALVGPSGAGKSTVFQLLLRFYDINDGGIFVDQQAVDTFALGSYRSQIGVVPQEVILFGGTIRENIAYGKPNASEDDIIAAAKKANAWEFIDRFPEGLETVVGDRGLKLSGGQRQRIAIARAILKDPAILILDEATSSLDASSEVLVQEALNHLMQNRTTLIIAHRLSTIRNADRILVLNEGRIVEQGSHDELTQNENGMYRHLLKLQFQEKPEIN